MKKSKVIIPAMALLLFSTAASISGTVAWFTATRVVSINAGNFVVNNIDDGLTATVGGGVGTHASTPDANAAVVDDNTKLTHGSIDVSHASNPTAWIFNKDATGDADYHASKDTLTNAISGYGTEASHDNRYKAADKWFVKDVKVSESVTEHYYVAFSWTITFTYTFNFTSTPVGIYLNPKTSSMTFTQVTAAASGSEKTGLGFRIAFLGSESATKVYGNNPAADVTTLKFTKGEGKEGSTNIGTYTTSNYITEIAADGSYTPAVDVDSVAAGDQASQDTANKGRADRVATITVPTGSAKTNTAAITCIAWFEGEDPNVISTAEMDQVAASLTFYARNDKATA